MDNPLVSITIITYNHEKYISQALDSVLTQITDFDYEIIIGEDCSTDNTRKIVIDYKKRFPDKIELILHEKNQGPSKNNLFVLQAVKGKYIAPLEGDDYFIDKFKLQKQVDFLEKNKKYIAVASNMLSVNFDGTPNRKTLSIFQTEKTYKLNNYLRNGFSIHGNTLLYKNIFDYYSDEYINLVNSAPTMGDINLFCLLYDKGPIYTLKDTLVAHRKISNKDIHAYSYKQNNEYIIYTKFYIDRVKALENYFEYKYDLTPLIANRVSGMIESYYFKYSNINKLEFKKTMKSLPKKTRRLAYFKFVKNQLKRVFKKMFAKLIY